MQKNHGRINAPATKQMMFSIHSYHITVPTKTPHFLKDNKNKWLGLAVYKSYHHWFKSSTVHHKSRIAKAVRFFYCPKRRETMPRYKNNYKKQE